MESGGGKWEVVVKVGVESEVAMHENGKWWSKWVCNLKWPCVKVEVVVKVSAESEVAMSENGSGGESGCRI
jgi:hypothetical protein